MKPRKMIAVLVICMSCLLLCPALAYADDDGESLSALVAGEFSSVESQDISTGDIEGPDVDLSSMSISTKQVTLGDAVRLSVRVSDPAGVAFAQAVLEHVESGKRVYVTLGDDGSGTWRGSMAIDDVTPSGEWRCSWLTATDGADNSTDRYAPGVGYTPVADLSAWDFTVSGTTGDLEGPDVDLSSLAISTKQAIFGDAVLLSVRMSDPAGVAFAQAVFEHVESGKRVYVTLGDDGSGTWRGLMAINKRTPSGEWRCSWLTATDGAGNDTDRYAPGVGSTPVADLSAWDFTVVPYGLITYKDGCQGSVFADSAIVAAYGSATPAFSGNLFREGYLFNGWTPVVSETVRGDAVYTATWIEDTRPIHIVTYTDGCGGAVFADIVYKVREGEPTPSGGKGYTRQGYLFGGWDTAPAAEVLCDVTYTAKWIPTADFVVALDEGPIRISISNSAVSSIVGQIEWKSSNSGLGSIASTSTSIGANGLTAACDFYPRQEGFATLDVVSSHDGTRYGTCTVLVTPRNRADISAFDCALSQSSVAYNPDGCRPKVTLKNGDVELVEGQDFWVEYINNAAVGNAAAIAHGMGSYSGEASVSFTITPVQLSEDMVALGEDACATDAAKPLLVVKLGDFQLVEGVDYSVAYAPDSEADAVLATVIGKKNYSGVVSLRFTGEDIHSYGRWSVTKKATYSEAGESSRTCSVCRGVQVKKIPALKRTSISGAVITGKVSEASGGKAMKLTLTVKVSKKTLKKGVDYTVSYEGDVDTGAIAATVTGKGAYYGSKQATFYVAKAANPLVVKAAKKTVKVAKLKKKAQVVSGAVSVSKAKGKVSYAKVAKGSSKKLTVNAKNGKITVKKGTKAGTYKVKVKVTAKGTAYYKSKSKTVTVVVVVK